VVEKLTVIQPLKKIPLIRILSQINPVHGDVIAQMNKVEVRLSQKDGASKYLCLLLGSAGVTISWRLSYKVKELGNKCQAFMEIKPPLRRCKNNTLPPKPVESSSPL
jgi:membrane carboxypeptidase/penicillin-binding protein PbpC